MNFFRKIKQNISSIITQTLMLLTIPWHLIAIIYLIPPFSFLGLLFLRYINIIKEYKKDAFPILTKNPNYLSSSTVYYTKNVETASIHNDYGTKIGSITEKELAAMKTKILKNTCLLRWKLLVYMF